MAGGKGTRVAAIAGDVPKPMIPILDKPILEYQIEVLKDNNLTDIIIVTGHLARRIEEYFGDGGRFGCKISYFTEAEPLGTAGALYKMKDLSPNFILLNGDIIFDIDFSRLTAFHAEKKAGATIVVHPNNHPYDSALVVTNDENQVTDWLNKEDARGFHKNQVNAGIHVLSVDFIKKRVQSNAKVDLDRDILKPMIKSGDVFAYSTPEYIRDMGAPDRFALVAGDIARGIVKNKNLKRKQKAVFLDRDGTINTFNDFITKPETLSLIDGAAEAVKTINSLGYLAIVITNQPVVARGEVDFRTLELIHMKMEMELGKLGAFIDDLFFCPHHPDRGFAGERLEYKIDCDCRKPKPGMISRAAEKYNIDLSVSYMVGDDARDVQAGINAGCVPVFLTNGIKEKIPNINNFVNLKEFSESLKINSGCP